MQSFTDPILLIDNQDGTFTIKEGFVYYIGYFGSDAKIIVPAGFITDGTSSPWYFHWLIPAFGKHSNASYLHDACYKLVRENKMPRRLADWVMLEACTVLKIPAWKRYLIFYCLRCFGWMAVIKKLKQ